MRMLLCNGSPLPPELYGGAERSILQLADLLRARGVDVAVLCRTDARDEMVREGALRRAPVVEEAIPLVVDSFRPDVVFLQTGKIIRSVLAAGALGLPLIVNLQGAKRGFGGNFFPHPQVRYLATSRHTAAYFDAAWGLDCAVFPPCMDLASYATETTRERVLFVNPNPVKGVERAFRLAEARPDIPFTFVEAWRVDRQWSAHCRDRAARAGNIEWSAAVDDMRRHYGRARLVLAPSVAEEGWCRVVTEGQASGIPSLASDRGALPENVGDGGLVVPLHAPDEEWLAALDTLWSNAAAFAGPAAAMGRRPERAGGAVADGIVAVACDHIARWPC